VFTKGATELVLDRCTHVLAPDGSRRLLREDERQKLLGDFSQGGQRWVGPAGGLAGGMEQLACMYTLTQRHSLGCATPQCCSGCVYVRLCLLSCATADWLACAHRAAESELAGSLLIAACRVLCMAYRDIHIPSAALRANGGGEQGGAAAAAGDGSMVGCDPRGYQWDTSSSVNAWMSR
jgi:xanthine/CO dehydrogenase XdhC/CoxF family maturation factor